MRCNFVSVRVWYICSIKESVSLSSDVSSTSCISVISKDKIVHICTKSTNANQWNNEADLFSIERHLQTQCLFLNSSYNDWNKLDWLWLNICFSNFMEIMLKFTLDVQQLGKKITRAQNDIKHLLISDKYTLRLNDLDIYIWCRIII